MEFYSVLENISGGGTSFLSFFSLLFPLVHARETFPLARARLSAREERIVLSENRQAEGLARGIAMQNTLDDPRSTRN